MPRNDKGQFTSAESLTDQYKAIHEMFAVEFRERKDPKESAFDTRKREAKYWLQYCQKHQIDPEEATEDDVKSYIKSLLSKKSGTTIDSYYTSVRVFYRELNGSVDVEFDNDPCADLNIKEEYDISTTSEFIKEHELREETDLINIRPETVEKIFDHVPGKTQETRLRNEVLLKLIWYTACRSDEIARIQLEKINHDDHKIIVRSSKLNRQDHPDLYLRPVFYPEDFEYLLQRWINIRETFSSYAESSPYLFLSTQSGQLNKSTISRIVKEAAHNAGVQEPLRPANPAPDEEVDEWLITAHRLRRAAISHWVNDCDHLDIYQARVMAGHSDIEQTINYLEPDKEQMNNDYQRSY